MQMLTELTDELPVGVCAVTSDLQPIILNKAARELLQLPDELFANGLPHFSELVLFNARRGEYGPGDPQTLATKMLAKISLLEPHRFERTRPDGTVLDVRGAPMRSGGLCNIWTDITQLHQARAQAQMREQEVRRFLECAPGPIGHIDQAGVIRMANQRLVSFYGLERAADVEGRTVEELIGAERYAQVRGYFERAFAGESLDYRREFARDDGSTAWLQLFLEPKLDDDGIQVGIYSLGVDITALVMSERKLLERNQGLERLNVRLEAAQSQLMQSEKLASIGQLAAGVAHEINNPIGFVASNANTLERYVADLFSLIAAYEAVESLLPADAPGVVALHDVKQHADLDFLKEDTTELLSQSRDGLLRVKKIVQDLKDFSHAGAGQSWEQADVERCLDSTLTIAANEVKYMATVVKEYGHPPPVECIPSQLNQVFLNMVVNAGHSIEQQGRITVRTGQTDEQVWIEFEDTGSGMSAETMHRIFEPFFTTKAVGQGTGLGLSLSYGIVQKHHGRIEVQSELGVGTRFRIWLPMCQPVDTRQATPLSEAPLAA